MKSLGFFKQFIKLPEQTGAVIPSGKKLCYTLANSARVGQADLILEFGTGTGVVTEEIIRQKRKTAHLIGLEINSEFADFTCMRCPEAEIINESAVNAPDLLIKRGHDSCDAIVSGLPWAGFPEGLQDELLGAALEVLKPGGRFVTFAYLQGLILPAGKRFKLKLEERFATLKKTPVIWANFPPAIVYIADKEE